MTIKVTGVFLALVGGGIAPAGVPAAGGPPVRVVRVELTNRSAEEVAVYINGASHGTLPRGRTQAWTVTTHDQIIPIRITGRVSGSEDAKSVGTGYDTQATIVSDGSHVRIRLNR